MDRLPADAVESRERVQVAAGPLEKIDVRVGEEVNKARRCRGCNLPLYNSEGVQRLCPWCWGLWRTLVDLAPYDALEDELQKQNKL